MKKIAAFLIAFFRKLSEASASPALSPERVHCVHCATPFIPEPNYTRTTITRPSSLAGGCPNITYLDLCDTCGLKLSIGEIKFVSIAIGRNSSIHYIWEDASGQRYERYEYGRGPAMKETKEDEEVSPE